MQVEALVAFHSSCVEPPALTVSGLPENVRPGTAGCDTAFLKPGATTQPGFCAAEYWYAPASGEPLRALPLKSMLVA